MNNIQSKYLSTLRAFVQGTEPEPLLPEEVGPLLQLASIHSTRGMVSYVYKLHPQTAPAESIPLLRRLFLSEIALYAHRAEQMKLLLAELTRRGIDCLLFKGAVVRDYYPEPELRTFGDIDFVIRREDRVKCHEQMIALGYEPRDTWEPVYSYRKDAEYYEIHTDVMETEFSDKADYGAYYSHIWEHTRPVAGSPRVLEFAPEFHFLYLLTHIAKHISASGAGMRMYLDIAFFLRRFGDTLDWDWVAGELETLGLRDFANVALTAAEQWFGVSGPLPLRPVERRVMEDFLRFTLEGGVYGYYERDKGTVFLKQQNRKEENGVSRAKTLLFHAFPPVKSMKNRYTYLQKQPWLLPAAWLHRLFRSRKDWRRFAINTRDVLTADPEEVRRLKRMYKDLGL